MNFHNHYDNGLNEEYRIKAYRLGAQTHPANPDQLSELGSKLNQGVQNIELTTLQQEIFEQIPKQHFEEMQRLAKLTNAKIALHAPIADPAGFTQQGWSEEDREQNERYFKTVIDKAHRLDPTGNIPVTIHSTAGVPYKQWKKGLEAPSGGEAPDYHRMIGVERESGKLIPLDYEKKQYLGGEKVWTPEQRLRSINETSWDQEKLQLLSYSKNKDELKQRIDNFKQRNAQYQYAINNNIPLSESEIENYKNNMQQIQLINSHVGELNQHINSGVNEMYHKFQTYLDNPQLKQQVNESLSELNAQVKGEMNAIKKIQAEEENLIQALKQRKISEQEFLQRRNRLEEKGSKIKRVSSDELLAAVSRLPAPKMYVESEEFALDKSSETMSNIALHGYSKYKDKAPIVSIENFFPEYVLSRADSLKELVKESRQKFSEKLSKEKKININEARKIAEKLIGATWDTGHINQLRKFGYTDEEIMAEHKKIAQKGMVKHLHLTDNFGFHDSHLPPGMGNVPNKEVFQELEKSGFEGKAIIEAGAFTSNFKTSALPYALEGLDSSIYRYDMGPAWEGDTYAHYKIGHGNIFPDLHFGGLYGGGFAGLPRELGGEMQGNQSRFSGTPNQ